MPRRVRHLFLSLVWLVGLSVSSGAAELAPAITSADLDGPQCVAYSGAKAVGAAPADALELALGLRPAGDMRPGDMPRWSTGPSGDAQRFFRIAFKAPVRIGTILTTYSGSRERIGPFESKAGTSVGYLKADAAYPGDVNNDAQWVRLPDGPVKTLPPGASTRALRFEESFESPPAKSEPSTMGYAVLLQGRYYSALNLGGAKVRGPARLPEVWTGNWTQSQTLAGLLFFSLRAQQVTVEALRTDATEPAPIAGPKQWQTLEQAAGGYLPTLYVFAHEMDTRAVRLSAPPLGRTSSFGTVVPLADLGDRPTVPTLTAPPPPYQVSYQMPMDGFAAIDIHDAAGKLVRRLVGEAARDKGPVAEHWDLKDNDGALVAPGTYTWKGIARPPFKLTYELTVNNAGQPAWWAPPPGKGGGGWMADHSTPFCAAAVGDTMFLGSQVAESGQCLIATDLDGNKLWGEGSVSWGFSGPERIASDGRYAYLVNDALVQRVDPANHFATRNILLLRHTRELPGNGAHWTSQLGGAAAYGDKLYISYSAPPVPWLQTGFLPDLLDPQKSLPRVWLTKGKGAHAYKGDKNYDEAEYDELQKLYGTFLTETMPEVTTSLAGSGLPSSTQAYYDGVSDGQFAGTETVVFKQPVAVGSVLLPDAGVKVYALKPKISIADIAPSDEIKDVDVGGGDAAGGGGGDVAEDSSFREDFWTPIDASGPAGVPGAAGGPGAAGVPGAAGGPAIATTKPGGLYTRALRFKARRLVFAQVMSHRFLDRAAEATRVFGEGNPTAGGGWRVSRDSAKPINQFNPASMALVWPQAVELRGIALVRPDAGDLTVDNWIGPANADPKTALDNDADWSRVGEIVPEIYKGYFPQPATLRNVDFGGDLSVRALRIRAVKGNKDAGSCSFEAVVAAQSLGDDLKDLPPELSERLTEIQLPRNDTDNAKILREIPLAKPGNLAFDAHGTLYAVSDGAIVTVPLQGDAQPRQAVSKTLLDEPTGIAFDREGNLFVGDWGRQVVKVFDVTTGKLLRSIGTPGGEAVGPWDPSRMNYPSGVAISSDDRLWTAEKSYQPKRIARWSHDGQIEKWFLGPTEYGGGGWLDEGDKRVLNYHGMKFTIDWENKTWKLDSILFRPVGIKAGGAGAVHAAMPDRVLYCKGTRYLVGDPTKKQAACICVEKNGVALPMVVAGNLGEWDDVAERPDLAKAFGSLDGSKYGFVWVDRNGDHIPQASEVQITDKCTMTGYGLYTPVVGEDLSLNFHGWRLRATGMLANGTPDYDLSKIESTPLINNSYWATADGRTFVLWDRLLAPDGKTDLWEYRDKWAIHDGFYIAGFGYDRPPGVLNAEHRPIGHFTLENEEYFVTNSDQGDWFCFTGDGMLAGCIMGGPTGYGKKQWTMPEWEPGKVDLSDLRPGQEHYQGCVVKADDGKVYAVAGHNHNSIVRVEGLESLQRLHGTLAVTAEDLGNAQAWELQKAAVEGLAQEPKVAPMPYVDGKPVIDGSLGDWPEQIFFTIHDFVKHSLRSQDYILYAQGALAYDDTNLYIAAKSLDDSPMMNSAQDLKLLFKYGDALDVQLGMDADADPKRKGPVAGDFRLLITRIAGQPVAEIFRYKVPGSNADLRANYQSPVGSTSVDQVEQIQGAEIAIENTRGEKDRGWIVEAAIPWKSLGYPAPKLGSHLRGDMGILQSDQNGVRTAGRLYWSGKSQTVIADTPSEARLSPSLWGDFYTREADKDMKFGVGEVDLGGGGGP